jgi:hypothetical protein
VEGGNGGFHEVKFVINVTSRMDHFRREDVEVKGHVHLEGFRGKADVAV